MMTSRLDQEFKMQFELRIKCKLKTAHWHFIFSKQNFFGHREKHSLSQTEALAEIFSGEGGQATCPLSTG